MLTAKRLTPILTVDEIDPCLPFWTGLGFEVTATVPHEDATGFAMLEKDGVQVMYQSHASVEDDVPGVAAVIGDQTSVLFLEVNAIEAVLASIAAPEVLVPRRTTFYGMDEIFVKAPCGTVVGFAARVEEPE